MRQFHLLIHDHAGVEQRPPKSSWSLTLGVGLDFLRASLRNSSRSVPVDWWWLEGSSQTMTVPLWLLRVWSLILHPTRRGMIPLLTWQMKFSEGESMLCSACPICIMRRLSLAYIFYCDVAWTKATYKGVHSQINNTYFLLWLLSKDKSTA